MEFSKKKCGTEETGTNVIFPKGTNPVASCEGHAV